MQTLNTRQKYKPLTMDCSKFHRSPNGWALLHFPFEEKTVFTERIWFCSVSTKLESHLTIRVSRELLVLLNRFITNKTQTSNVRSIILRYRFKSDFEYASSGVSSVPMARILVLWNGELCSTANTHQLPQGKQCLHF